MGIWADAPFFGQIVDLNLLLCTVFDLGHADLVLCLIFTQGPNAWSKDWAKQWELLEQSLLIQSNNDPFFAVSSLPALWLLRGCCSMAKARLRRQTSGVAVHSRVGRTWRAWWTTLDVTGVEICLACLSAMRETSETFKLRGIDSEDTIQM